MAEDAYYETVSALVHTYLTALQLSLVAIVKNVYTLGSEADL
jgi:hypothetical protein